MLKCEPKFSKKYKYEIGASRKEISLESCQLESSYCPSQLVIPVLIAVVIVTYLEIRLIFLQTNTDNQTCMLRNFNMTLTLYMTLTDEVIFFNLL